MDIANYKTNTVIMKDVCLRTHAVTQDIVGTHTVGLESQVQGIRNDDQSLSPVTPLVSSLFLSFLIP